MKCISAFKIRNLDLKRIKNLFVTLLIFWLDCPVDHLVEFCVSNAKVTGLIQLPHTDKMYNLNGL